MQGGLLVVLARQPFHHRREESVRAAREPTGDGCLPTDIAWGRSWAVGRLAVPTSSLISSSIATSEPFMMIWYKTILLTWQNESDTISRKVLKQIAVSELQPDETVDAVREARLLAKVNLIFKFKHIYIYC